jgi:multicomponent K+:H+ antiporter subunit E
VRRWLPFPLLWLSLTTLWLLLNQTLSVGHLLLGALIAWVVCHVYRRLDARRGTRSRPWRRAGAAVRLFADVAVDIARSNAGVARIVLDPGTRARTAGFLDVPIDLHDPLALATLACIVTATPGTAWAGYDADRCVLTLHILDLIDEAAWIQVIKDRYETRLREIFE